jgi:hypothetical protein
MILLFSKSPAVVAQNARSDVLLLEKKQYYALCPARRALIA